MLSVIFPSALKSSRASKTPLRSVFTDRTIRSRETLDNNSVSLSESLRKKVSSWRRWKCRTHAVTVLQCYSVEVQCYPGNKVIPTQGALTSCSQSFQPYPTDLGMHAQYSHPWYFVWPSAAVASLVNSTWIHLHVFCSGLVGQSQLFFP